MWFSYDVHKYKLHKLGASGCEGQAGMFFYQLPDRGFLTTSCSKLQNIFIIVNSKLSGDGRSRKSWASAFVEQSNIMRALGVKHRSRENCLRGSYEPLMEK